MHVANLAFWNYCKERYARYFSGNVSVLEVGSFNVNGTVRQFFSVGKYVGVDWRAGEGVDVVSFAHEMALEEFDCVISASMLEHDPYWMKSLSKMVQHLKKDGILLLSWGAALNLPHEFHTAVDGEFHPLPAKRVLDLLMVLGIHVQEFHYEGNLFPELIAPPLLGNGEVVLVGFLDPNLLNNPELDELLAEDMV